MFSILTPTFSALAPKTAMSTPATLIKPVAPNLATPAITPKAAPTPAPTSGGYTVKSGDTLSAIAAKNGISLATLLQNNSQFAANPNLIRPGQTVNLGGAPAGSTPAVPQVNLHPNISTPSGATVNPSTGALIAPPPGGAPAQNAPVAPIPPPVAPVGPTAAESADTAAADAYKAAQGLTPEETQNTEAMNALEESYKTAYENTQHQPIPLEFITGQSKALEERKLGLAAPLQAKAALLQAKRTASLDTSKFALDRADQALASERSTAATRAAAEAAANKPVDVAPGGTLVNPATGKTVFGAPPAAKTEVVNANGRQLLVDSVTGKTIRDLGAAPKAGSSTGGSTAPADNPMVTTNIHTIQGTDSSGKQFNSSFINLSDFPDAASKKEALAYGAANGVPVLNPSEGEKMVSITNAYTNIDKMSTGLKDLLATNKGANVTEGLWKSVTGFFGDEGVRAYQAWRTAIINNVQALAGGQGSGLRINEAEINAALKNDLPIVQGIGADTVSSANGKLARLKEQLDSWRGTIITKGNAATAPSGGNPQTMILNGKTLTLQANGTYQ